jgi:hypothetical protein
MKFLPFSSRPNNRTEGQGGSDSASVRSKKWKVYRFGLKAGAFIFLTYLLQAQSFHLTQVVTVPSSSIVAGNGMVIVNWNGGTPPYQVQCTTNFGVNWQDVGGVTYGNACTNILVVPSAFYRVASVSGITATNLDQTAPTSPVNLMATTASSNEVDLTWNSSSDPGTNATGVKAYNVYRDGVFLLQVASSNNFAADTSVHPSTTNNYIVTAVDYAYNQSSPSSQADALTPMAGTCTYTISQSSFTNTAAGSSNNVVSVTAAKKCTWSASSGTNWIIINSVNQPNGPNNNGTVVFSVLSNPNSSLRTGLLTVANQTITVTQAAAADTTPPAVTLTSPANNSVVNGNISLAATASDNVGVVKVEFYRDGGTLLGTGTTSPYNLNFDTTTVGNGSHTFSAKAYDAANNSTMSVANTVTVSNLTVSPPNIAFAPNTGSSNVAVTAAPGYNWTASTNAPWINITSGNSGTGNGTVSFTVAANNSTTNRTGMLMVTNQTVTITQLADTNPPSATLTAPANGSTVSNTITLSATASDNVGVAKVEFYRDGGVLLGTDTVTPYVWSFDTTTTANGSHSFFAKAYDTAGNVKTSGTNSVTVNNAAPCNYTVSPLNISSGSAGISSNVTVTAGPTCGWTATANAAWITITSGSSGTGNGSVNFTVSANTNLMARTNTLTVAGQTVTVVQPGDTTAPSVTLNLPANGSTVSNTITLNATASDNVGVAKVEFYRDGGVLLGTDTVAPYSWGFDTTTITNGSQNFYAKAYDVAGNSATSAANTVTVNNGVACSYTVSPLNISSGPVGISSNVTVTAGATCGWSATANAGWITITSGSSGTGNGSVNFTVSANTNLLARTNTLTVAGQTVTVVQPGDVTAPSVTLTAPANGSTVSNTITLSATASDNVGVSKVEFYRDGGVLLGTDILPPYTWSFDTTTITNGSQNFYAKAYDVAGNSATSAASTVTVNNGVACSYTVSPLNISSGPAGISSNVAVTTGPTCGWSATANGAWITITSGSSGTGNGSVNFTVSANTNLMARTNTLTVAGQTVTVVQSGDTTAPTVTLTAPVNGSTVSNTITPTATTADNVDVAKVEFYRDSAVLFATVVNASLSANYSASTSFDTTTVSNGSHSFYAKAYDAAGNVTTSSANTVTVNNAAAPTNAPGQLQWLRDMKSGGQMYPESMAVDHANNAISVGSYEDSVGNNSDFGGGPFIHSGGTSGFIAKYNSQNVLLWATSLVTSNGQQEIFGVSIDSQNNILVTGYLEHSANFAGTIVTGSSGGDQDIFVAKYSPTGSLIWVKLFGGSGKDIGTSIAVDRNDNVLCGAKFSSSVANYGGVNLTSLGGQNIAIAKLSGTNGATIWAENWGSGGSDSVNAVAVDSTGNVFVTGQADGPINLGGGAIGTNGVFIAKYSGSNGSYLWARAPGGTAAANGITADPNTGYVFITGNFTGSIDLGGGTLKTPYGGTGGFFVAAYDPSGTYSWAKVFGANLDAGYAITVDGSGNLAVAGSVGGTCIFDANGDAATGRGFIIANFTTSGTFRWAIRSNTIYNIGSGVAFDQTGHVLGTGFFQGTASFGSLSATASGVYDGFLVQYTK